MTGLSNLDCMPLRFSLMFIAPKILNHLAFQFFDFERTSWRLFQKRLVRTQFDIYVFIRLFWYEILPQQKKCCRSTYYEMNVYSNSEAKNILRSFKATKLLRCHNYTYWKLKLYISLLPAMYEIMLTLMVHPDFVYGTKILNPLKTR
jgi:hypothetical protein